MQPGSVKISIVICTYNRAQYLPEAFDSLRNQTVDKQAFEIIVVNNNSTDNTAEVCEVYKKKYADIFFTYLLETRQGASFARNTGAAMASGELLCFMDDDAIAYPDYLEKIMEFFEQTPDAGGLGGRIIPRYIPEEPKWMSHFVSSLVGNFDYSKEVVIFSENKYPLESNMIIRKKDFDAVGGFNINLPGVQGTLRIGGEGKEFFFKLKAIGRIIYYHPQVIVEHVVETKKLTAEYMYRVASGIGRGERVRTKTISTFSFYKKIIEYLYKLGGAIVLAMVYLLKGTPAKMKPVIQFRIDALKGLLGY
jgi:glycosyltransferase involved in cell wall biosynthesis